MPDPQNLRFFSSWKFLIFPLTCFTIHKKKRRLQEIPSLSFRNPKVFFEPPGLSFSKERGCFEPARARGTPALKAGAFNR